MARTRKSISHWPMGHSSPYVRYRYHNSKTARFKNNFHSEVRHSNKGKDEIGFISISKKFGCSKSKGMSWVPGELFGGKWSVVEMNEAIIYRTIYDSKREYVGGGMSNRKISDLQEAAKKQMERRGQIGRFMGHKDKLKLYKGETFYLKA